MILRHIMNDPGSLFAYPFVQDSNPVCTILVNQERRMRHVYDLSASLSTPSAP